MHRAAAPAGVPLPLSVHFPNVVTRSPLTLIELSTVVAASHILGTRVVDILPLELRILVLEELRKSARLTDATLLFILTLSDGTPRLPPRLNLRNCLFATDKTLRMISDLRSRDPSSTLAEIDLRGCPAVTVRTIYELFGPQTPKKQHMGMGRPRQDAAKPLVRVRTLPLPILFALEAERLISGIPYSASATELRELLESELSPSIHVRHRVYTYTVESVLTAVENRFGLTVNEEEQDLALTPPPTTAPRDLTLCRQLDVPNFIADIRISALPGPSKRRLVSVSHAYSPVISVYSYAPHGQHIALQFTLPPNPAFLEDQFYLDESPPGYKQQLHSQLAYRNVPFPHHAVRHEWHPTRLLLVAVRRTSRLGRNKSCLNHDGDYTLELWSFEQPAPHCLWNEPLDHHRRHSDSWLAALTVSDDSVWIGITDSEDHRYLQRFDQVTGKRDAPILFEAAHGVMSSVRSDGFFTCTSSVLQLFRLHNATVLEVARSPVAHPSDKTDTQLSPLAKVSGTGFAIVLSNSHTKVESLTLELYKFSMQGLVPLGELVWWRRLSHNTADVYGRICYSNAIDSYRRASAALAWTSETSVVIPGFDGDVLSVAWTVQQSRAHFEWRRNTLHCLDCTALAVCDDEIITGGLDTALRLWRCA